MALSVDPFDPARFAPPAPETANQCPKCRWHQPPAATICAACGLVFAKYEAAERRRRAQAMTAALAPEPINDDLDADFGSHGAGGGAGGGAGVGDHAGFGDSWGAQGHAPPTMPALARVPTEGVPLDGIVSSSVSAAAGTTVSLVMIQMLPLLVLGLVVGLASALALPVLLRTGVGSLPAMIIGGVVFALVGVRLWSAVWGGSMILVDDAMRDVEPRGALGALGEGWARGGRTTATVLLTSLAIALPMALPALMAWRGIGTGVVATTSALAMMTSAWISIRLSLAMPAAVLGHNGALDAMSESLELTGGRQLGVAGTLGLAALVIVALSVLSGMVAIIPILGFVVGLVANAFIGGIAMGTVAGLWRRLAGNP